MSTALDVITANPGDLVRREQARELAAGVVQAVFRVVKLATIHAMDNQAVARQVAETAAIVRDYGDRTGQNVSILFAQSTIFVNGQLLKASRATYEGAIELGTILQRCGFAELSLASALEPGDVHVLAAAIAETTRGQRPPNLEQPSPRVRLRPVAEAALARELSIERLGPEEAIVRAYASAVVAMRRFFEALEQGRYYLPQRIKRIAQILVDLSAGETPAFLGVTAAKSAGHDEAGRAVNTAILSLAIARQITADALALVRIAMAALLYDTGRSRLLGIRRGPRPKVQAALGEKQDLEVPASTAVVLTSLGRVNEPSLMRTVIAYEAHWMRRRARLGPLYRGLRQPSLQARILAVARAWTDRLSPAPGAEPPSVDRVLAELDAEASDAVDRTVHRLLVGALGLFPAGTLVELSTGETAVVVETPSNPSRYAQPRVRLVFDASGGAMAGSFEIELAAPEDGVPRHIVRVVAMADGATAPAPSPGRADGSSRTPPPSSVSRTPPPSSAMRAAPPPSGRASSPPSVPTKPSNARASVASFAPDVRVSELPPEPRAAAPASSPPGDARATLRPPVALGAPVKPSAEGNLQRTPLAHLLVYVLDQRLSGSIVFAPPSGEAHTLYVEEGRPAKIKLETLVAPLDRVILELGLLDEATLRASLMEISRAKMLHGRYLVSKGLLEREAILRVLAAQLERKLLHLFELPAETTYAFYQGTNLIAPYGGPELTPCEPLAAIMAGVRVRAHDPVIDATLGRLGDRPLALHIDADVRRFELQRDEAGVADLLRARPMSIAELASAGAAQERVVRTTVYALAITRHLDLGNGKAPVGVGAPRVSHAPPAAPPASRAPAAPPRERPAPSPAPPPVASATEAAPPSSAPRAEPPKARTGFGMGFGQPVPERREPAAAPSAPAPTPSPASTKTLASTPTPPAASAPNPAPPPSGDAGAASAERRADIERRIAAAEGATHYALLGVSEDATAEQIQAAYFALAKRLHPDRLPADLGDLRPGVTKLFARLNDAFQTLSDADRRLAYARELRQGGAAGAEDQEKIARVVDAALEFQKAEILFRKHDLAGAEALVTRAVAADPDQPEYLTLLVWIQAQRRIEASPGASPPCDDLVRTLDAILGKEPRYERALFYRGMLLKRAGRADQAIRDFRLAAEINPKNIDAVREVRLHDMRKQRDPSPPSAPSGGGLLGKFFKK